MDLDNDDGEYRTPLFSPSGAIPIIPVATEEDVTYIFGKNQANKIVENRKLVMGKAR